MVHCFIQSTSLFHFRVSATTLNKIYIKVLNFTSDQFLIIFVTGLGLELEELMVEGFLLQVTLPETEELYRYLLYKLAPLPSHSPLPGHNTEQDQESPRGSPHHNKVI